MPKIIHKNWEPIIGHLFDDERYEIIRRVVHDNLYIDTKGRRVFNLCPTVANIYRVFQMNPYDIRVVILGLSPYWTYHNKKRTAIGRAFAIPNEDHMTPSMSMILDALAYYSSDLVFESNYNFDYTLEHWENQGIMLLNRYLTSIVHQSDSTVHKNVWDWFTKGVINGMSQHLSAIVFNLWGNDAKEVKGFIDENKHYIVEACHPQATNYALRKYGMSHKIPTKLNFIKQNPFKTIDDILYKLNGEKINWYEEVLHNQSH